MNCCHSLRICLNQESNEGETSRRDNRELSNSGNNDCSICLESLDEASNNTDIIELKCGHTYHQQCIQDWRRGSMESSKRCPLCRASFAENEINSEPKHVTVPVTNNNYQISFELNFNLQNHPYLACCMELLMESACCALKYVVRFLTGLMVSALNGFWFYMYFADNTGLWMLFVLCAAPATILFVFYCKRQPQDSTKTKLLIASFILSALPVATYISILMWHIYEIDRMRRMRGDY